MSAVALHKVFFANIPTCVYLYILCKPTVQNITVRFMSGMVKPQLFSTMKLEDFKISSMSNSTEQNVMLSPPSTNGSDSCQSPPLDDDFHSKLSFLSTPVPSSPGIVLFCPSSRQI